jgi:flagellum-specific ATP synthase
MHNVAAPEHIQAARRLRQLWSRYQKARDLIALGAYAPGNDAELDAAVQRIDAMRALLQQDMRECASLADGVQHLRALTGI